jgi:SAM-dependent methyltransferase
MEQGTTVTEPLWLFKLRRAWKSLLQHGPLGLLRDAGQLGVVGTLKYLNVNLRQTMGDALSRSFDRRHNVDTKGTVHRDRLENEVVGTHGSEGHDFESVPVQTIKRALNLLPKDVSEFTFLDIGCGKGRPLLLAQSRNFRRIIGIEHSPMLSEIARRNIETWRGPRLCHEVQVVCTDALTFELPREPCVLYFACPFADHAMVPLMMANVSASLRKWPRPILVIYVDSIEQQPPDEAMRAAGFRPLTRPGGERAFDPGETRGPLWRALYQAQPSSRSAAAD